MSQTSLTALERDYCFYLNELFLDDDHSDAYLEHITLRLHGLEGSSLEEMKRFFWYELYPVLIGPLLAWHWGVHDNDWVCNEIEEIRNASVLRRILEAYIWLPFSWFFFSGQVVRYWETVERSYQKLDEGTFELD